MADTRRVIETPEQVAAIKVGTVVLDANGAPWERGARWWYTTGSEAGWGDDEIALPAHVLVEHWERGVWTP